jgi:hypothetical protein
MNPQEEEELGRARQRIAELERIIEDLSDHNVAAERLNLLKAQEAEIQRLRQEMTERNQQKP